MHRCSFIHEGVFPEDLRELLEDELYSSFVSGAKPDPDEAPPGGHPAIGVVRAAAQLARFGHLTRGRPELSEKVAHDVVHWCANRWAQAREAERRAGADAVLERLDGAREAGSIIAAAEPLLRSVGLSRSRTGAILSSVRATVTAPLGGDVAEAVARRLHRAARRHATNRLKQAVGDARRAFEGRFLRSALPAYMDELNASVPDLAGDDQRIRDIFGTSARLWDREAGTVVPIDWPLLEHYAALLREEPSLVELARLLGRGRVSRRDSPAPVPVIQTVERSETLALGRSEVRGIAMSSDVGALLPSEVALLAHPETQALFDWRFAEGKLLTLDYHTREGRRRSVRVRRMRRPPLDLGPIILCVDASGSMAGTPEEVAKAISLAVAREALEAGRRVFVITFSDRQTTFEATDIPSCLPELTAFLGLTFRGGTELRGALHLALDRVEEEAYRNADILVVSDFRVPKLFGRLSGRIAEVRERTGLRLYSLTVTDRPVEDVLNIFDRRFHYDIANPQGRGIPVHALRHVE